MSRQLNIERVVTCSQLNVNSMSGPTVSWKIVKPQEDAESTSRDVAMLGILVKISRNIIDDIGF